MLTPGTRNREIGLEDRAKVDSWRWLGVVVERFCIFCAGGGTGICFSSEVPSEKRGLASAKSYNRDDALISRRAPGAVKSV